MKPLVQRLRVIGECEEQINHEDLFYSREHCFVLKGKNVGIEDILKQVNE